MRIRRQLATAAALWLLGAALAFAEDPAPVVASPPPAAATPSPVPVGQASRLSPSPPVETRARLKDLAVLTAASGHQLLGYGLIVGLAGTGDSSRTLFTEQTLRNLLERMGLRPPADNLEVKNLAAVMVTAEFSPFLPRGGRFDVTASSLGDCTSLQGGTLLATPLRGSDGKVYALAQGPVSVGGFGAGGRGASEVKNHLAVARVPQGGWVVEPLPAELATAGSLTLTLRQPDFTTAVRLAEAINAELGVNTAEPLDAASVRLRLPAGNPAALLARLENLEVTPETPARVVINERTGTVVMGERVRILPVAVAHGGLTVRIRTEVGVSQPPPLSGGSTVVIAQPRVEATEEEGAVLPLSPQATLQDLVEALNTLGVKPRDLIAIIQALRQSGALQAELVVM